MLSYNLRRKRVEQNLAETEMEEEDEMEPPTNAERPKVSAAQLDVPQSGLIGPNYRLPMELLQEIFLSCLPDDPLDVVSDPRDVPLLIAHVCHFWREVALATPRLWSSIYIDIENLSSSRMKQRESQLRLLRLWISRSGSCPLALNIGSPTADSDERGPATGLFWRDFGIIFAQAQRLHHISILTPLLPINRFFHALCKRASLPLETLCVDTWGWDYYTKEGFLSFVARSPNITHLKLNCYLPSVALLECLRHMPRLEILDSDGYMFTHSLLKSLCPNTSSGQVLLVPMLKELSLKDPYPFYDITLAEMIRSRWEFRHSPIPTPDVVQGNSHVENLTASRLERVTLDMCCYRRFEPKALAIVQDCIQEGLSFSIIRERA